MNYKKIALYVFMLISVRSFLSAELLIVKQEGKTIVPLSQQDIISSGDGITKTVLKYQWPVCTGENLSLEEQEELLSPDKPCGEELFIAKKLQQAMQEDKINPQVVFVPTTLYELFFINRAYDMQSEKDFFNLTSLKAKMYKRIFRYMSKEKYTIGSSKTVDELSADLENKNINELFQFGGKFYLHDDNLHLDVNQAFLDMFFKKYPEAKNCHDAAMLSACIQEKSHELSQELLQAESTHTGDIVRKFIDLEYEARQTNKALLTRGTRCQQVLLNDDSVERTLLIGSTQLHSSDGCLDATPYSISFGSSLFAGWHNDKTGCVYQYLKGYSRYEDCKKIIGYTLLVDKKSYVQDNNSDLLLIPPLPTITSVVSSGEYFHPRTKVARFKKDTIRIKGVDLLYHHCMPPDELFVKKDPLQQAEDFSRFIAQNGRIIQAGQDCDLTDEEKQAAKDIINNQQKAALFYKKMRDQSESAKKVA